MKEKIMEHMEFTDYFGHETEAEFLDWAIGQFKERADITVTDKSEMAYAFELGEQDGCCELCYTENARVEVEYKGTVLVFTGYYSYEDDTCERLVVTIRDKVEVRP